MPDAIIMAIESVRTRAGTGEALITFSVPLEQAGFLSGFMSKIGHQVGVAFCDVQHVQPTQPLPASPPEKSAFGQEAKALKLSGFFRVPEVWKVLGSDAAYLEWIRRQPSAHSGEFSEQVDGEGRCEAAHVRRIESGAGTSIKPQYSAIPLTHEEHLSTHTQGESYLHPPEWFERERMKYVEGWAWQQLRKVLKIDSMKDADPKSVFQWANFHGVEKYLPREYGQK